MMRIYQSEKFLKKRLLSEPSYEYNLNLKIKKGLLTDKEALCLYIHTFCKNQYNHYRPKKAISYNKYFTRGKDGWYHVDMPDLKGRFKSANRYFDNKVYCEEANCHACAYSFVLNFEGDTTLILGSINPFNLKNGLLHSVCIFTLNGEEYVFDGGHYLVMERSLYYQIFNFIEYQKLSKEEILQDLDNFAVKPRLKQNKFLKLWRANELSAKFYGFGFLTYLFDRQDYLDNYQKQNDNFSKVVRDYNKFEEKLEKLENKYKVDDISEYIK